MGTRFGLEQPNSTRSRDSKMSIDVPKNSIDWQRSVENSMSSDVMEVLQAAIRRCKVDWKAETLQMAKCESQVKKT